MTDENAVLSSGDPALVADAAGEPGYIVDENSGMAGRKYRPAVADSCKNVAIFNALMALRDAEIVPPLAMPPPFVLPKTPMLPTLMP